MEKKYHVVYVTTNLKNGKQYIGDHSTNNINDIYIGSGKIIKLAIKEYGRDNFKKEIIECFSSKQKAFDAQEKYIKQFNTLTPNGYNISPKGGYQTIGGFTEEAKKKISVANSGRIAWNKGKKVILSEIARKNISDAAKKLIGDKNGFYGKTHSDETKEIIRQKAINFAKETNGNMYGKTHSIESRKKMSNSQKGRIVSNETKEKIRAKTSGVNNPNSKLSIDDVDKILNLVKNGESYKDIAIKFNVSAITIYKTNRKYKK